MKKRHKNKLQKGMKVVVVAGGFDIPHGGHVTFFEQAAALGDYLVVQFASEKEQVKYKGRKSAYPADHKRKLLDSLWMVDEVVMGGVSNKEAKPPVFDFADNFLRFVRLGHQVVLASTTDDPLWKEKQAFAKQHGAKYVRLPKDIAFEPISATEIRQRILSEPLPT